MQIWIVLSEYDAENFSDYEVNEFFVAELLSAHRSEESAKTEIRKLQAERVARIERHNRLMGELWRSLGDDPAEEPMHEGCLYWPGPSLERLGKRLLDRTRSKDKCKTDLELQIWDLRESIFPKAGLSPQYSVRGPFEVL